MPTIPGRYPIQYPGGGAPLVPWQDHFQDQAQSVADAMDASVLYLVGTTAERDAIDPAPEGAVFYATDTNALSKGNGSTWEPYGFGPFKTVNVTNPDSGTVISTGSFGPITGLPLTTDITVGVACRAKISLAANCHINNGGSGLQIGIAGSGATTIVPASSTPTTLMYTGISATLVATSVAGSWLIDLNPGTTTLSLVGLATGSGATRTVRWVNLIVEPVSE